MWNLNSSSSHDDTILIWDFLDADKDNDDSQNNDVSFFYNYIIIWNLSQFFYIAQALDLILNFL